MVISMNKDEINKALGDNVKEGNMDMIIEPGKETEFRLTDKGLKGAEQQLKKNPEAQLFIFGIVWNSLLSEISHCDTTAKAALCCLHSCESFKKMTGINLWEFVNHFGIAEKIGFDVVEFKKQCLTKSTEQHPDGRDGEEE